MSAAVMMEVLLGAFWLLDYGVSVSGCQSQIPGPFSTRSCGDPRAFSVYAADSWLATSAPPLSLSSFFFIDLSAVWRRILFSTFRRGLPHLLSMLALMMISSFWILLSSISQNQIISQFLRLNIHFILTLPPWLLCRSFETIHI
jgi:hypothetical protein